MSSEKIEPLIDLGELPFYIGEQDQPTNPGLPDALPFKLGFRSSANLIVQLPDMGVEQCLEHAYRKGSIVGSPMSEMGVGRQYTDDFLSFIERAWAHANVTPGNVRALELGCGSGYLLYRLKQICGHVLGVEPGEHGQAGAKKYNVEIVRGMFDSHVASTVGLFDAILHFTVLEHVMNPVGFLLDQANCLSPTGMIIFAVPDCGEYIRQADVSMLIHEHWSYFSPWSLKATVEAAGLKLIRLERARFGGCLYAVAAKNGESVQIDSEADDIVQLESRFRKTLTCVARFFADNDHHSVGVYCPGRFFNLLHLIKPPRSPRFFDDAEILHGKFYPTINVPIESRNALLSRPVDELLIMSRSFGEKIKAGLEHERSLRNTKFRLPSDILGA